LSHIDLRFYQRLIKIFSHNIKWFYTVRLWWLSVQGKNWTNIDCLIVKFVNYRLDSLSIIIGKLSRWLILIVFHGSVRLIWFYFFYKLWFWSWTTKSKGWNLSQILNTVTRLNSWQWAEERSYCSPFPLESKSIFFTVFFFLEFNFYRFTHKSLNKNLILTIFKRCMIKVFELLDWSHIIVWFFHSFSFLGDLHKPC